MPGATLASISAILKNQYLGPVREQVNNKIILLKRLGADEDSVVGKNFTIPLHYGRNEGIGAAGDGGALPTAGSQAYKESIIPMKYLYGRIQLTGPTIKAASKNEGAFIRAVESEMKGLATDLKSDMNRQIFGDGSGKLATAGVTGAATLVVVVSTSKLRVGMIVDIIVAADGTTSTGAVGRTITAINSATTFTISGAAITTDATFGVYRTGSRNLEVMGLSGIVAATDPASAALQNLAVATYPWWIAQVLANGGTPRSITELLLQSSIDAVDQNSDGNTTALFTTYGVRRAYQALLTADRVYQNEMDFEGGFKALSYNGKPLFVDKDCQASTIYGLDEDSLKFLQLADWDWMDQDGAILSRVSGVDAYEATMYKYCELGTNARNKNFVLKDITEA